MTLEDGLPGNPSPTAAGARIHAQELVSGAADALRVLLQQRNEITQRIETIKRTLNALAAMFGEDLLTPEVLQLIGRKDVARAGGLTATCRQILLHASGPLRSIEICELIKREHPEVLQHHKDPIASITTILNRLISYGEVRSVMVGDRRAWESVAEKSSDIGG